MVKLLLATHNRDKMRECREMLGDLSVNLLALEDFPDVGEIIEDADSIEGNALKKAREAFRLTGMPVVADDTGLQVFYLNGEPGVYSSRYSGPRGSYDENCRKLLKSLRGVPPRRRGAQFRSVLAFIPFAGGEEIVEGICEGTITENPTGENGFGYDPIFLPRGYTETFGEMNLDLKNRISHRARAFHELRVVLTKYLKSAHSQPL
jgi:XTP/dITP diphosphohydrolase